MYDKPLEQKSPAKYADPLTSDITQSRSFKVLQLQKNQSKQPIDFKQYFTGAKQSKGQPNLSLH